MYNLAWLCVFLRENYEWAGGRDFLLLYHGHFLKLLFLILTIMAGVKGDDKSLNGQCTAPLLVKRDNIHWALPTLSRLIRICPSMTEKEVSNEKEMNSLLKIEAFWQKYAAEYSLCPWETEVKRAGVQNNSAASMNVGVCVLVWTIVLRVCFCFSINTGFLWHLTWGHSALYFSKRKGKCEPATMPLLSSLPSLWPNTNWWVISQSDMHNQFSRIQASSFGIGLSSQHASLCETQVTAHYGEYMTLHAYDWTFGLFIYICIIVWRVVKDIQNGNERRRNGKGGKAERNRGGMTNCDMKGGI